MRTCSQGWTLPCALLAGLFLTAAVAADRNADPLPRFTEEREAAALHFVKKNLKELLPVLDQLKKNQPSRYEREIREIFQVTEWLADLRDEPSRHEVELNIWIAENRAYLLVARLSTPNADERKRIEAQLLELARELVELDIQALTAKVNLLKQELGEAEDDLGKTLQNRDKHATERYESLLKKVKQGKK